MNPNSFLYNKAKQKSPRNLNFHKFQCSISVVINVSILVLILKCTILISDGDGEEHIDENEMEICDPCHCYGKCCLDVVASIFCVSLL